MPQQQTTTYTVTDSGDLQGRTAGQDLITWLSNVLELFAGGRVEISVSRPTRSLRQNRFLWGWVYKNVHQGLREAGVTELHIMGPDGDAVTIPITMNFIHLWLKMKHLQPEDPGEEPSTTDLSTTEFSRYVEAIRHDETIRRYEIDIPDPHRAPVEVYEDD